MEIFRKKIKYIPNGVDLDKFSGARERAHLEGFNNPENKIIVGIIAPLRPEKNLSRLIRCFNNTREDHTCLIIVGEGVERPKLEKLVEELKIQHKVFFAGHTSAPENVIGLFDIFAISSDTEQMPNSVNEAMAAGLPIVGTDVGDVKHIVCDKNKKYIVPADDEAAYSMAMKNLINDHLSREAISKANLIHVQKHYDRVDMYKKYAELWGIA
jgi:glycosyltransferase involved in cell wall biosynthesis